VKLDKDLLRLYLLPALGDHRLGAITGADVAALLRKMRAGGLSESTLHRSLTVFGAVFRLARARRIVTRSPLDDLDAGERPRRRTATTGRRLDEAELALLVSHTDDTYRTAIALLAYTGCRISEALALRWHDVDLVDSELNIRGQITRASRNEPARIVPRKGGTEPYFALIFPRTRWAPDRAARARTGSRPRPGRRLRTGDAHRQASLPAERRPGARRGR
jgi:integrase